MNVWNLIDGMDGLASGVGLLVSGTLTLVAIHNENFDVAVLAVGAGGEPGGLLALQLAPGLHFPGRQRQHADRALDRRDRRAGVDRGARRRSRSCFRSWRWGCRSRTRRWRSSGAGCATCRLSAADRRHVHHLLIGLGLNPRQAALMLYCFSGFLCGVVMLGVALQNEYLTLILGIFGLPGLPAGRDQPPGRAVEPARRLAGSAGAGPAGAEAAKLTWEAIQRIELCTDGDGRLRDRRPDGPGAGLRAGSDRAEPDRHSAMSVQRLAPPRSN